MRPLERGTVITMTMTSSSAPAVMQTVVQRKWRDVLGKKKQFHEWNRTMKQFFPRDECHDKKNQNLNLYLSRTQHVRLPSVTRGQGECGIIHGSGGGSIWAVTAEWIAL